MQRELFELLLRVAAFGDVADVGDDVADVGVVDEIRRVFLDPAQLSAGIDDPELGADVVAERGSS